jgi:3-oxoacid CoA-transferase subunit A
MENSLFDYRQSIGKMGGKFDHIYCLGDIHGRIPIILESLKEEAEREDIAVILLGDVGANYYGGAKDHWFKTKLNNLGVRFYCLRGNHERHPKDVLNMNVVRDLYTEGLVYWEEEYPNLLYLVDGETYEFNDIVCLALGGAYSVDKWHRLERGWHWFANEQIEEYDREAIKLETAGNFYDVVLSHTSPYSWQPTDLFIDAIDQNTVDNSMEWWLEEMSDNISWGKWLCGHFHETRYLREGVAMMLSNDYLLDLEEWYNN